MKDKVIARSPCDELRTPWKRPQKPIRLVPTEKQFEALVAEIRAKKYNADAEDSGDFIEFLGTAGLGQAEAKALKWGDIDWKKGRMAIRRQKTGTPFYFPLYPKLKNFFWNV